MNRFSKKIFFINGCRTPFQASGTGFKNLDCYELGSKALNGLICKFNHDIKNNLDYLVMGNVIQDSKTSNIARESMLVSGFNKNIPSYTVTMACISSNKSITDGVNLINANQASSVIAGGAETMTDLPIKLSKKLRLTLFESRKWKTLASKLSGLSKLKLKDFGLETPSITEFSTNETMGYSADKLAEVWNVSREEQDEFALRSHKSASSALKNNLLTDVINTSTEKSLILEDNIIKHNTNTDKLIKLKPVFRKDIGTITAGNASSLTDGASACLLANEEYVKKFNLIPKVEIIDYIYTGCDPKNELLLGPAYSVSKLLEKNNLKINDFDVFEIHEAFAGQVLANLNALNSDKFKDENNLKEKIGLIPIDKLNNWGGSLSLGHPFAATGVRLLNHMSNRLILENGELGLIASCAAGGLGHAMIVKRCT